MSEQSGKNNAAGLMDIASGLIIGEAGFVTGDIDLLIDGPDTYAAMQAAIRSAQHYVYLESYGFGDGEVGQEFARLLKDRARDGVDVYLVYDSFGSRESDEAMFNDMRDASVKVCEYNPLSRIELASRRTINARDHRKILVVDGSCAFTGGLNISERFRLASTESDESGESGWRDTHAKISGPAVGMLAEKFEQLWEGDGKPSWSGRRPEPQANAEGLWLSVLAADGTTLRWSAIRKAYLRAIQKAERRIWITQAYFIPDRKFKKHLMRAARRGVDVRVISPSFSDRELPVNAARSHYNKLLKAGVRIYELQSSILHAKTAVVDGVWSTLGSSNLDQRSFMHNNELNIVVVGEKCAAALEAAFEQDLNDTREIDRQHWSKRPMKQRFKEWLARLVEYWV